MDIPTYDTFMERHDAKGQNIITKLVIEIPGLSNKEADEFIKTGALDVNKIDFSTLNTVIANSPSGFSQDISIDATLTQITGAKVSVKSARKATIQVYANIGLKLNGAAAQANVTVNLVVDGIVQSQPLIFEFGQTDTSGVGLQSTRSMSTLLQLPIGRHTVALQAKFNTLANVPVLHISSFSLVYVPLGN